ncbi:MAG: YceI family protein [Ignavibacteria bacterium]|nr:YceI family protein [Ignavibacteria bacterium]
MYKLILALLLLISVTGANAQEKYMSRTGHVSFFGETPLETIEAHNNQVATVINIKNGTIAFDILIKSFKFERALMEEHFNENYIESSKFPKSTFSGKFVDFDVSNFTKPGSYSVNVEGDLTIHGIKKHVKTKGAMEVKAGKISAKTKFSVKLADYGIQIPSLVKDKITPNFDINVDVSYEPFK